MTKYSFILLSGDKENFLEKIQELGVVDITRSSKPVDGTSAGLLEKIQEIKGEISDIKKCSDEHSAALKAQIAALKAENQAVEPWGEFEPGAFDDLRSKGLCLSFYCCPSKKFNPGWAQSEALQVVCQKDGYVWFTIVNASEGFELKALCAPSRPSTKVLEEISLKEAELEAYLKTLSSRASEIPALEEQMASLKADFERHMAGEESMGAAEDHLCCFEGYSPDEDAQKVCSALDTMDVYYWKEKACVEDNPPIKLRNNGFVRMFEVLTDMYGRPAYNGFDPTPFISIFFLLFFAMCVGDAGYGIVLMIVGLLLRKVKSFRSLAPLVVTLGAGTVFVGFFFHTFFSVDISQWEWIPDGVKSVMVPASVGTYDGTMVLALIVGMVHLLLAMIVKTIYATKNKGFLNSLSTWGWTVFWVGLALIGLGSLIGVIDSGVTKTAIIVLGIVCAIGIFPLNNIHRNPLVNIGSGLWDAYNMATGILGDVLSYLRLYALGLAGAMLGFAFNDLAKMALGDGGLGWIPFVLIAVIGHTLNIAMAALGAFVHPLRLNFLEFFKNSDYEGVGLKYNPLKK